MFDKNLGKNLIICFSLLLNARLSLTNIQKFGIRLWEEKHLKVEVFRMLISGEKGNKTGFYQSLLIIKQSNISCVFYYFGICCKAEATC